jgi:hypothetical protein
MATRLPWLRGFTQITFDGSNAGVTVPALSDPVAPAQSAAEVRRGEAPTLPAFARVFVVLTGSTTNTEIVVSAGVTDVHGITGWNAPETQEIRTLPNGTKVVTMFSFATLSAASITVFLESAITGGATARLYIAFQDGH